jgi:nucleotide-binding universal stress UspA family protein
MFTPKLILAPTDFSEFSFAGLEAAKDLAKHYGAELLLLHVVPVVPSLPRGVPYFDDGVYEQELIETARKSLDEIAEKIRATGTGVRTSVGFANDAAMEIIRTAEDEKVDLIVIPTHGMTGWRRLAFGSVTEKVVRIAECPVLVLRSKAVNEFRRAESKSQATSAR